MTIKEEVIELSTPTGPMRTCIFRPTADGKYPGLLLFSEIFQITGPIRRTASLLAGHGFIVAAPEIFHELESIGAVIPYDQAGAERGNADKIAKELGVSIDERAQAKERVLERLDVAGGSPSISLEEREDGQRPDHLARIQVGDRGDPDGDVAEHLHCAAAGPAGDDGTEQRVVHHADQDLHPCGHHPLHEEPLDRVPGSPDRRGELRRGTLDLRQRREAEPDCPRLGLVDEAAPRP